MWTPLALLTLAVNMIHTKPVPEEEGFKAFTGAGASLLGDGADGVATGVFQDQAADLDAQAAGYLDNVDRLQQEHDARAAQHLAEKRQREAQLQAEAEERAKQEQAEREERIKREQAEREERARRGEDMADMNIGTHETVEVLDPGLVPHKAQAVLDTGNAGHTLITVYFARRLGLVDAAGMPRESGSRTIQVQGVVAGASERVHTMHITYILKGKKIHCIAGVTEARFGCDLLISRREIMEFEADGYRFTAR
ncbi:hypothetical protein WJX72_007010 [[Myrmecia] bisecta]|uniref:Uncharacterized protein n=1 Tax=[Myrmecia] bisecta TaxID=41462 RepID=A0AAW1Q953_9CHLO